MASLEEFEGREDALRRIKRFNMARRTPMFYRTNDLLHVKRVHAMLQDVRPILETVYGPKIDMNRMDVLSLVHDDAEIITDDVTRYVKDRMTPEEIKRHTQEEERAIDILVDRWPAHVDGYAYRDLLVMALRKDQLEPQILSYLDKVDGYCECIHEILAGNERFMTNAEAYVDMLNTFDKKFPGLEPMLRYDHPFFSPFIEPNWQDLLASGAFHTPESIRHPTGIQPYDGWKDLTITYVGSEVLTTIRES